MKSTSASTQHGVTETRFTLPFERAKNQLMFFNKKQQFKTLKQNIKKQFSRHSEIRQQKTVISEREETIM